MYASRDIGTLSQVSSVAVLTNPGFPRENICAQYLPRKNIVGWIRGRTRNKVSKCKRLPGKFHSIFKLFHPDILKKFWGGESDVDGQIFDSRNCRD